MLVNGLLASCLLGVFQAQEEAGRRVQFADPVQMGFEVPPSEAIDFFRSKQIVARKEFDLLSGDARAAAFTVAGVYRDDVLKSFKREITAALEQGTAQQKVIKRFRDILAGAGHRELGAFHLETVFRTNMSVAYGVGRRRGLEAVTDDLPFWEYHAVMDDRTRPAHAALNGTILPADHEFWRDHFPPWGFNCRCTITATDEIPAGYDHNNPSGDAEIHYDDRGNPAKAEIGTSVVDLAVGQFSGIPPQGGLKAVIQAGVNRATAAKRALPKKVLPFDEQLEKHERTIIGRKTEMAILLDETGKTLFKKTSRAVNYVKFTKDELGRMKGLVLTHNHPSGQSLSIPDVRLAMAYNLTEIRAVGRLYRYSIKPRPGGWSEDLWTNVVESQTRIVHNEVFNEFMAAVRSGRMTQDEASLLHWHEVWTRVAQRTGLVYERTAW